MGSTVLSCINKKKMITIFVFQFDINNYGNVIETQTIVTKFGQIDQMNSKIHQFVSLGFWEAQ
jgi:hypothetical protein